MKNFIHTTVIALLMSSSVFSQKDNPGTHVAPSQTTVMVGTSHSNVILLSPTDGKSIAASDASKPVLFRWTAVSPKPKEAVTYRLRVWQLMQGQNGVEAMRTNQPIITKDVANITQATISNLYTGPCRPPYLCDFVWGVEVLNSDGVSLNNGSAVISSFEFEGNKGNAGNSGMVGGKSLNGQGDPVHGVDVKLGAAGKRNIKNPENTKSLDAQGDPVHGVDVKLGTKSLTDQQPAYALYLPIEKIIYDADGNVSGVMIKTDKGESGFVKVVVAGSHSISGDYMMLKTEKGESITAKVVVAGSHSLSGGVK